MVQFKNEIEHCFQKNARIIQKSNVRRFSAEFEKFLNHGDPESWKKPSSFLVYQTHCFKKKFVPKKCNMFNEKSGYGKLNIRKLNTENNTKIHHISTHLLHTSV